MYVPKPLLTLLALAATTTPLVQAVGNAIVINQCSSPVWLWSVGGSVGPSNRIDPGQQYSETLHYDQASGGIAIKITTDEGGLYNGSPQTNFAYTLDGQGVWYDLSDVFGDAFSGHALKVVAAPTCPAICWPQGVAPNGASETKVCGANANVTLTLCAETC
ncbi:hypothetical protein N7539_005361 [Penicillium diatomitis]|uniref:BYS1 domain protein n=1 Tax=Penicillium diatomitis TaxID=2819901 RepID=A0A9W9X6H5_9EURO|nr:uncharacterized protein N7539_005361 [Penicillium diatomitis]KAJ5485373.1 hypothetical protein N7539_005361 [Penicillium diatomitis]